MYNQKKQPYLQRFSKTFKLLFDLAHNSVTYKSLNMYYHCAKIQKT